MVVGPLVSTVNEKASSILWSWTMILDQHKVMGDIELPAITTNAELGTDVIKLFPFHNRFVFRMTNKLRMILQEIDFLIAEMNTFRFKFKPQSKIDLLQAKPFITYTNQTTWHM